MNLKHKVKYVLNKKASNRRKIVYNWHQELCGLFAARRPEAKLKVTLELILVIIRVKRTLATISALRHLLMALCSRTPVNFP